MHKINALILLCAVTSTTMSFTFIHAYMHGNVSHLHLYMHTCMEMVQLDLRKSKQGNITNLTISFSN